MLRAQWRADVHSALYPMAVLPFSPMSFFSFVEQSESITTVVFTTTLWLAFCPKLVGAVTKSKEEAIWLFKV